MAKVMTKFHISIAESSPVEAVFRGREGVQYDLRQVKIGKI